MKKGIKSLLDNERSYYNTVEQKFQAKTLGKELAKEKRERIEFSLLQKFIYVAFFMSTHTWVVGFIKLYRLRRFLVLKTD